MPKPLGPDKLIDAQSHADDRQDIERKLGGDDQIRHGGLETAGGHAKFGHHARLNGAAEKPPDRKPRHHEDHAHHTLAGWGDIFDFTS